MARRTLQNIKRDIKPDRKYDSVLVQKAVNKIMWDGKKMKAETMLYGAFEIVQDKLKTPALEVFEQAIENISPVLEVKSRRVGGANYQIPYQVKGDRKTHLALMWLINSARNKTGKSFQERLANEIMDAYNETGAAFRKKEEMHRMAEANKAFAHLARY